MYNIIQNNYYKKCLRVGTLTLELDASSNLFSDNILII